MVVACERTLRELRDGTGLHRIFNVMKQFIQKHQTTHAESYVVCSYLQSCHFHSLAVLAYHFCLDKLFRVCSAFLFVLLLIQWILVLTATTKCSYRSNNEIYIYIYISTKNYSLSCFLLTCAYSG